MDISKWNNIMSSFQELLGYQKGITEVLVTKRLSIIGRKSIPDINTREEKYLVHILRKRYREISNGIKKQDKEPRSDEQRDNGV
tara:strand:- start:4782 stop:5033 length:252 start_codon:yes stop_codon:yes gene_type:complete